MQSFVPYYKPAKSPSLAQAAASSGNPFGLAGASDQAGTPPLHSPTLGTATKPGNVGAARTQPGAQPATPRNLGAAEAVRPAAPNAYDLNTDPALQQIQALAGMNDQQAQSQALKERQNLLLQYGDPDVAAAVLGANDPTVQAARQNPTSTRSQLSQSRDRNLKVLEDGLNKANLSYSGYRVTQEQQAGQDYQNALAQAAAGLNSNLDTVSGNLASALAGNQQLRAQGIQSAADRASQLAMQLGVDPGALAQAAVPTISGTPTPARTMPAPDLVRAITQLFAKPSTARPGGVSANKRQGVYTIH